ncbi:MAG: hypothetical protein CMB80_12035 [Flammeovirgaceae bacterium]|nr:hypothetical protein [Flammeovirgaceae bacterium]MBR10976.1 hypothetical protein [Rickettsiales bacterium]|tara:strand:- start:319 stop:897 length:579 start_codon:yes stop_codon:yes gene_type:complete
MEFEDMQKIWNADSQQYAYAINEDAMKRKVMGKKIGASRKVNRMEILLMGVNLLVGSFILGKNMIMSLHNPYLYALTIIFYGSVIYMFTQRLKRLKGENDFDRTMLGDINHAISNATYQERLSIFAFFYGIPVFAIVWFSVYESDKSAGFLIGVTVFFILTLALSVVEHRMIHRRHKRRLIQLKQMLVNGEK